MPRVLLPMKEEDMHLVGEVFCLPMTLIINFSLFQYLATFYYARRHELHGKLLIFSALGGVATLVPYAHPNETIAGHLNDMSETFSVLTFLIQIVIVGRDVNRKVRIRSLKYVSLTGELLVIIGLLVVLLNTVEVILPHLDVSMLDGIDNVFELATLCFIFAARFYYIVLSRGVRETLRTRKLDILFYLLFVTHEYPFMLLTALTGVSWEAVQAIWMRVTIMLCIVRTIQEKMRSKSSKLSKVNNHTTTNHTIKGGPQEKSLFMSEDTTVGPVAVVAAAAVAPEPTKRGVSFKSIVVGASNSIRPLKAKS